MKSELEQARTVFLETSVIIYFLENHPLYASAVAEVVQALKDGIKNAVTSYITLFEVLTKPFEAGREDLVAEYKEFFLRHPRLETHGMGPEVAELAARYRAKYRLKKAPDAIQLATAKLAGAGVFFTNDSDLKRVDELCVVLVSECVPSS